MSDSFETELRFLGSNGIAFFCLIIHRRLCFSGDRHPIRAVGASRLESDSKAPAHRFVVKESTLSTLSMIPSFSLKRQSAPAATSWGRTALPKG